MSRLWEAKSQHLGLPLSFTKYYVEDGILFMQKGFLSTQLEQVRLYRVVDLSLKKNLLDRIFGQGTVIVSSKDKSTPILELARIPHPEDVLKSLNKWTEEERRKAGFKTREIIDDDDAHDDDDDRNNY